MDLIKTYANYLLSLIGYKLNLEFDSAYNYTERVILKISNDKKIILNDEEFLNEKLIQILQNL